MPPTTIDKRRSRTGCLTCRTRRRKCDERRPRCVKCEIKGLLCRYGVNVTFIESNANVAPEPLQSQRYSTIKFVNDESVISSPAEAREDSYHSIEGRPRSDTATPTHSLNNLSATSLYTGAIDFSGHANINSDEVAPYDDLSFHEGVLQSHDHNLYGLEDGAPLRHLPSGSVNQTSLRDNRTSFLGIAPSVNSICNDRETTHHRDSNLLRHYRYHIAPWLDLGDQESQFGINVLLDARDNAILYNAVIALAARHLSFQPDSVVGLTAEDKSGETSMRSSACPSNPRRDLGRGQIISSAGLDSAQPNTSRASYLLQALDEVLSSTPRQWNGVIRKWASVLTSSAVNVFDGKLDAAVFWTLLRIDLAASIAVSKPPILPYTSFLPYDSTSEHPSRFFAARRLPGERLQHALSLLVRATIITFGGQYSSNVEHTRDPSSVPQSTQWASLWTENQKWRSDCPPELQHIIEVRGKLLEKVDPQSNYSFPIIIFSSMLARVANICYHSTCLLLLTHKPRLVRPVASSRSSISLIWHAQCIAGIATCTEDSPESWDPILIAGLLLAAVHMSHVTQQAAIIEILHRVKVLTGFRLDEEIEDLQRQWSVVEND